LWQGWLKTTVLQTAFIPGRNILEGVVIIQEVLHEMRVKKNTWNYSETGL